MAITSLTLSSMCSCAWLQSSAPPPRLRICYYSSTQHSVHKTLTHIHSSGVVACLRANSAELALKAARAALSGGISVVYPVSALGGSQYISALKRPFHHISMVASQGITIDSIREYITQGASAVVLSDAIFDKEAISQNNFNEICRLAHFAALQGNEALQCVIVEDLKTSVFNSKLSLLGPLFERMADLSSIFE